MRYARLATDVNLGHISGLQKHSLLTLYPGDLSAFVNTYRHRDTYVCIVRHDSNRSRFYQASIKKWKCKANVKEIQKETNNINHKCNEMKPD